MIESPAEERLNHKVIKSGRDNRESTLRWGKIAFKLCHER
jgi:hypothetical protein